MLPNFLIIGAQKAATSWLAKCLGEHPDVLVAEVKEANFFSFHFDEGLQWYAAHFGHWSGQAAVGEATPGYLVVPDVPGRIHATLGDKVKLIASLRHPVDRAYSAFRMYLRRGDFPPNADFRTYFLVDDRPPGLRSHGYYGAQLSRYLEHFSRESLMVLIYEEDIKDSQRAVSDCFSFLGVDSQFVPDSLHTRVYENKGVRLFQNQAAAFRRFVAAGARRLPKGLRKRARSTGRRAFDEFVLKWLPQKKHKPLDPGLRQELLREYMPDIEQLESLLDRDLSIWYAPSRV